MIDRTELKDMAAAARAVMKDSSRSILVGGDSNPRFEFFNAAMSLCSQKVRTVFEEKRLPYRSNALDILSTMGENGIVPAEQYNPAYVRLRLMGGKELNTGLVNGYSGRTSVETEGFDPCVVPLLIDYEAGRIIADSQRICYYLDDISPEPIRLVPEDADKRAEVLRQVSIVDKMPNVALLYGFHPDDDRRPDELKEVMNTVFDYKVMALRSLIAANPDSPELVAAYEAKIVKESGGKAVCRDAEFQRAGRNRAIELLVALEKDLAGQPGPYLDGEAFSMGDVLWGCNLIRMIYLGLASTWADLPNVTRYADALVKRPSLCKEAIQATIGSLPPSAYMAAIADCQTAKAA
jgi:glutathione S-transferase